MTPSETWRPVVGYEGSYEVSQLGRVRSLDRYRRTGPGGKAVKLVPGRILKTAARPEDGRPVVTLALPGSKKRATRVHRLVMGAFVGPCPEGMEVCHNNGDCTDNRLENLRYDTKSANMLDRVRHGTHHNANKTRCLRGHLFTEQNTKRTAKGGRACRMCIAQKQRQRKTRAA